MDCCYQRSDEGPLPERRRATENTSGCTGVLIGLALALAVWLLQVLLVMWVIWS